MNKPTSGPPVDPRKRGAGGYAEQNPQNQSDAKTPPPPIRPANLDGGAARKHDEPNTLPDA
jgi:hypothetical protein